MTNQEIAEMMKQLEKVFDVVRLVDVAVTRPVHLGACGVFQDEATHCYAVWNKGGRCDNCIFARAFANKGRLSKFEFVDNDIFYVMAQYVEVEDKATCWRWSREPRIRLWLAPTEPASL